jgi:hypothetical protein
MLWTSGVFVIQKSQSQKHMDEKPCGAHMTTKASVNDCEITSLFVRLSIWLTKLRYDLLVRCVQESCKQEKKLA